ncbi:hypothetical protein MKW92_025445 [Papaver armeniacum]|nr:hypothetical protein MKW92_025445 [Papaver armeniacum]
MISQYLKRNYCGIYKRKPNIVEKHNLHSSPLNTLPVAMECIEDDRDSTYTAFVNLSLGETPNQRMNSSSCSLNLEESSKDLKVSLDMLLQKATDFADFWSDVNTKINDRRSFPTFLNMLQANKLDWHYIAPEDKDLHVSNQPDRRYLNASSSYPNLIADSNWVVASKYYNRSLSLMKLLRRIHSESSSDFSREQAGLLAPFLDHLITIQQEQRVVACGFSEHLEQLRKSDAVASLSSNAVDGDGDRHNCPLIRSEHALDSDMWQQKHVFDSLCIMSRESVWLLKQLNDSPFISPSSIEESNKILDIILVFIPKFKKSKESLDQYLLDECCLFNDQPTQLVVQNDEMLNDFGGCIKNLLEQGVERKSVAETLLGCFVDVVNMHCNRAERGDTCSSLQCSFSEAVKETSELINEAVDKLNSIRCFDLTGGGSPLGCIALWRILFESSLIYLRLDLICRNHDKTVKLGVELFGTPTNDRLDEIRLSINKLLTVGETVLGEFIAMHKTVAEASYMLGDAFTTGGAGMNDSSDETKSTEIDIDMDFPWDKHNVPDVLKYDFNNPEIPFLDADPYFFFYGPESDNEDVFH